MKAQLYILLSLTVMFAAGCFGGDGFNGDTESIRQSRQNAQQIALEISSENLDAAANYIHDDFVLAPEVAAKFNVGPFQGKGPDSFREFFQRVLDKYGDVELIVTVNWTEADSNGASLHVRVEFAGNNGNAQPHAELSFEEDDLLVFEWNGVVYALIDWSEDPNPNPPPHNQGGGHVISWD